MRKGLGDIYKRFLNSQLLLSKVEKHEERIKIFELIAKCQTPLEEKTEEEKRLCGTTVTSEIDEDEFIVKSLVSLNLPISSPENDIAFHSHGGVTRVFEHWAQFTSDKRLKHHARLAQLALNAGRSCIQWHVDASAEAVATRLECKLRVVFFFQVPVLYS